MNNYHYTNKGRLIAYRLMKEMSYKYPQYCTSIDKWARYINQFKGTIPCTIKDWMDPDLLFAAGLINSCAPNLLCDILVDVLHKLELDTKILTMLRTNPFAFGSMYPVLGHFNTINQLVEFMLFKYKSDFLTPQGKLYRFLDILISWDNTDEGFSVWSNRYRTMQREVKLAIPRYLLSFYQQPADKKLTIWDKIKQYITKTFKIK